MRILYLAHRIPFPPNKGDKLRSFRQIEHLSKQHEVWCACFVDRPDELRYVAPLRAHCAEVAAIPLGRIASLLRGMVGFALGKTVTESFYAHPAMRQTLRRWCSRESFDAVVAFSSSMAPYAMTVPANRRVLDLCDLDSRKWLDYAATATAPMRWVYRAEGTRLARREREWIAAFDASTLITEAEAEPVRSAAAPGKLHIVGNGVPLPEIVATDGQTDPPVVGFVGAMDYRPNVDAVCWFVEACWPAIRSAHPTAVFRIVGRSPTGPVLRLSGVPGVEVTGTVDDVVSEVRRFRVSVAPLRIARGLQNKVLEAMAAAKPVVLTPQAATGIAACHGEHFLVADEPGDVSGAVVRLLASPVACRRIGLVARKFVDTHHHWPNVLAGFEGLVTGVTRSGSKELQSPSLAIPRPAAGACAGTVQPANLH